MEAACFSESTINEHDYRIGFGNSPLSICSKFAKHTHLYTHMRMRDDIEAVIRHQQRTTLLFCEEDCFKLEIKQ